MNRILNLKPTDMIVDKKTDKLKKCICGFKPDHYSVAYGRTPYSVFCPNCNKQTKGKGGVSQNIVDYWNETARHIESDKDKHEFV